MKIVQLNISNFKRISAIEIRPDPHHVILSGNNGAGKSSVLDAIMVALIGPRAMPTLPVRQGTEGAEITVDCGDVVVRRRIKPDGTGTLSVRTTDGMQPASPQKWLDQRIGAIAFDPLSFTRLDAKAQANTLRTLVGVDMSDLDAKRAAAYDDRTGINRELKQAEALAATMPRHEGVPELEVSISGLIAEMQRAAEDEARRRTEDERLGRLERSAEAISDERSRMLESYNAWVETHEHFRKSAVQSRMADLEAIDRDDARLVEAIAAEQADEARALDEEIAEAEARLASLVASRFGLPAKYAEERQRRSGWLTEQHDKAREALAAIVAQHEQALTERRTAMQADRDRINGREAEIRFDIATLKARLTAPPEVSQADIQAQMRDAEATNAKVRDNIAWRRAQAKMDDAAARSKQMSANIAALDAARHERIASAKWPVTGLGFDETGTVTFSGVPLAQASQAEQIRVSMAIGLALNPSLRVVLIRDASLLDNASLALVAEMAMRADAQVWLERVSIDADAIVIEDGAIAETATAEVAA